MPATSRDKLSSDHPHAFGYRGGMVPDQRGHLAKPALRILYVEDNDDVRETTGMLLEGPNREVVALATGEEALALMAEQRCDVLFTDVNLPGISGEELTRHLLASEPDHWVVLCSGKPLSQEVRRWGPHVRVLPKLFRIEELEALLGDISDEVDARRGWS